MLTMARPQPPEERRQAFGRALEQAMSSRNVSQRELGEVIGIKQSAVSAWVNGEVGPDPDDVFEAERFLKVPPGHLSKHLGYLPPEAAGKPVKPTFETVVLDDPLLSDDAKRGLVAAYREFIGRRRGRGLRK